MVQCCGGNKRGRQKGFEQLVGVPLQAAEAGDAGQADKRRKKSKAAAEEAQFYVEDDDEADYQAPEGQDSRFAGTGAASPLCLKPQYHSTFACLWPADVCAMRMVKMRSAAEVRRQGEAGAVSCKHGGGSCCLRPGRCAGLESSDEEYQEGGEEAAGNGVDAGEGVDDEGDMAEANGSGEAGEMQSPGGRTGRLLKRQRVDGSEQPQGEGLEDDDMDDAVPNIQVYRYAKGFAGHYLEVCHMFC